MQAAEQITVCSILRCCSKRFGNNPPVEPVASGISMQRVPDPDNLRLFWTAVGKFALRALGQSLAREFHPQGIHVAHVIVDGQIRSERWDGWLSSFLVDKGHRNGWSQMSPDLKH